MALVSQRWMLRRTRDRGVNGEQLMSVEARSDLGSLKQRRQNNNVQFKCDGYPFLSWEGEGVWDL